MKKKNYYRLLLLLIFMFRVSTLVLAQDEIIVNHSDYFNEITITPEDLQVTITGLPNDNKIFYDLGNRKLISNTPVSIKKIDDETVLLQTQLEYEVSSNIYTFYTYRDAYPEAYEKKDNEIEWLYLRTCTDWDHANSFWWEPRPVSDYHLTVNYNSLEIGQLQVLGFQGWLTFNFSLKSEKIPTMIFNEQQIEIDTIDYYSILTSAIVVESSIKEIGEYDEYYNNGADVSLGSINLDEFSYDQDIGGDYDLEDAIDALGIYVDGNQPIYKETPFDSQQARLAITTGKDLKLTEMKSFISIQPDIYINKQNIVGRTISTPNSLDIDTQSGTYFSPAGIVNYPVPIDISIPRVVSAYVQNFNFANTYRLKFMLYSTLEIRSLNGTIIELDEPILNIGDRYIDLVFRGQTGADITSGTTENIMEGIGEFFEDLFTFITGIIMFIAIIAIMLILVYTFIRYFPKIILSIRKRSKKAETKKK